METLHKVGGTHLQGGLNTTYQALCRTFGEPEEETDGYKVDAEWYVDTPFGMATIYNYKDGKNYLGDEGMELDEITDWHVGGHNIETYAFIRGRMISEY